MSLDVYLKYPGKTYPNTGTGIWVRRNGSTVQISREEWDILHPGREPAIYKDPEIDYVFHADITHNLGEMADKAGLYQTLWRPEELGFKTAKDLIPNLEYGRRKLIGDYIYLQQYNPKNGWGNYAGLLAFVYTYLMACKAHPEAIVEVSR